MSSSKVTDLNETSFQAIEEGFHIDDACGQNAQTLNYLLAKYHWPDLEGQVT